MKYKNLSRLFTCLGFLASLGFPIWAVTTQVSILASSCEESILDRIGLAAGGVMLIGFIIFFTFWRYFSVLIREKFRSHRTLLGFFGIGYVMILCVKSVINTLEVVFLGGLIGATIAVVCFHISDQMKEKESNNVSGRI